MMHVYICIYIYVYVVYMYVYIYIRLYKYMWHIYIRLYKYMWYIYICELYKYVCGAYYYMWCIFIYTLWPQPPSPSLRVATGPQGPRTKCAASVSASAFFSCCELSRARRNLAGCCWEEDAGSAINITIMIYQ